MKCNNAYIEEEKGMLIKKLFGEPPYLDLDLPGLESQLAEVLVPVFPRVDFVSDLKTRLLNESIISIRSKKQNPLQAVLLGFAGVISGVVILLIGLRAILHLLSGKGSILQLRRQIQPKKTQAVGSAT